MLSDLGLSVRPGNPTFWGTSIQKADLYVVHWPDAIFWNNASNRWYDASNRRLWLSIARIVTNLTLLKARGIRILWFVHNLRPHDLSPRRQRAWTAYSNALARLVDGWVTLSPSTAEGVRRCFPALARTPHTFIWHPPYSDSYPGDRAQARAELGLPGSAVVFGHAGLLRPYKNLVPLAARFAQIAPHGASLLLTGMAQKAVDAELATLAQTTPALDYRKGKLKPEEFDRALKAMDVFVAPYAGFLHSGALVHALSRGCVVVAPQAPFTRDLAAVIGEDWVILYEEVPDSATLARAAEAAYRAKGLAPDLSMLEPAANMYRLHALLVELSLPVKVPDRVQAA